jgi:hypothetical protein
MLGTLGARGGVGLGLPPGPLLALLRTPSFEALARGLLLHAGLPLLAAPAV